MNGLRRGALAGMVALVSLTSGAKAQLPGGSSTWYGMPGLNAASGAQWVRAYAHTPTFTAYAGLEGGGVFKSGNGGATWSAFNAGFPNPLTTNVRALLTSGTSTVYAGVDSGIWKSEGGGAWQPMAQGPEENPADPKKLNESVQSIGTLPGGVMLAGVLSGGVFKSTDNGATWKPPAANNGMSSSETVYALKSFSFLPGAVFAVTHNGIFRSTDAGSTWKLSSDGIPSVASPIDMWIHPNSQSQFYASTGSNGIYRSLNGGLTWSEINDNLGAVRARGFQIFTGSKGAHLYAATENALWAAATTNAVAPPPPRWRQVTTDGLETQGASNTIMWALTAPVIPGAGGAPGLFAGTQSNGGYFLAFSPPASACPQPTPSSHAACPKVSDATPLTQGVVPQVGKQLSAGTGTWSGTETIEYAYQWRRCAGASATPTCTDIAGANESRYLVTKADFSDQDGSTPGIQGQRFQVEITAENDFPAFDTPVRCGNSSQPPASKARRCSLVTSHTIAEEGTLPGDQQASVPGITPQGASVGDTFTATYGITPNANSDGWFNPKATSRTWVWLRCDAGPGTNCQEIPGSGGGEPGGLTYTATTADANHELRVRVTGTNSSGTTSLTSVASPFVTAAPAALGDPILDPDTGQLVSQAPAVAGDAWVGETLAGTVGGWRDPTTEFRRRWVRCDADGTGCEYILKAGSTEQEDGPSYVVREADLGQTIRLWVTADVNHDYSDDAEGVEGIDNHLPNEVFVESPPTAVVTVKPAPPDGGTAPGGTQPGGAGPSGGGAGAVDTSAPTIQAATLSKLSFVAGKGTTFILRISEPASVKIVISKATRGRRVKGKCVKTTRKNRSRKKCEYQKTLTTIRRPQQPAGRVAIKFSGKVGRRKLRPGTYLATIIVTDAAGNRASKRLTFKVKRKRR